MKIGVFGLGYVGCVMSACLANDGHLVMGIDVNPLKVEMINAGKSPIIESGLAELITNGNESGKLRADLDHNVGVLECDLSVICVGTPGNENGSLKLDYVQNVCRQIGSVLKEKNDYHIVVVRSTVLPGTVEEILIPILEESSGKKAGVDFGVCMNPEFLREGSAIKDYYHPSMVVIGELDNRSGDIVQTIYNTMDAPLIRTTIRTAEMVKYTCNAFHALKVVFGNEIGILAKANGVDGQEVMEIICKDTHLNISTTYLRPGFAFGGSCLPKDLRAILYQAKTLDVEVPMLGSLLSSNHQHIQIGIKMIEKTGKHKIGILGMSFKSGTDDVRESPTITLIETLIGRGYHVRIFDNNIQLAHLFGANKNYLDTVIPHITTLMCETIKALIEESEVIVIANNAPEFKQVPEMMKEDQLLIDLVGIVKNSAIQEDFYAGICW
jgi:GDP-mannose 6-dehydrogenase